MENFYGDISGQNTNHLIEWLLENLPSDPGATTSRFFFNTADKRVKIADGNGGYRSVAWLTDLLGLSNWKSPIKAASTVAGGNVTLSGLQTLDDIVLSDGDYVLIKNQTDLTENGFYKVSSGAWTRIPEADTNTEITNSMCIVEQGTEHGGQIRKNTDNDPLVLGTDDIHFAQLQITVPMTDQTVKISMSDTTEKFLRESFSNIDAVGDALNNVNNIQFILENAGANESLKVALDLSTYIGNVEVQGDLHITGTTTLNDLDFDTGSTVNRDNTTQTGTTTYDNNYEANYVGSTINNTNVIENYESVFTPLGCNGASALPVNEVIQASATKADVEIIYDDGTNTDTITVTVTDGMGIVTSTLLDATITTERNNTSGNIEVRLTAGIGTATADVCQFSGGSIINNNGTIENNTDNIVNNNGTTENNTNVDEYYDGDSTVVNEGDVYNSNLTVENISYAESYVAGEALTNRQPLRMGVAALGEDTAKVYGANSTDVNHSGFIGFASKDTLINEELAVLQGPRVSGLEAVYGPLVDTSEYKLQDDGTIGLVAGTIDIRLGDADGTDTLVGLNAPYSLPPVQSGYVVATATYTPAYNSYNVVTHSTADTTINLSTAVGHDGERIKIKKFTGEDVRIITITPNGTELIDGFTGATMNIDRTMYTFTAIAGNRYLGD